jgi:hypothetical protein
VQYKLILQKKIQARDRQCGEKYKWEKDKGKRQKKQTKGK